MFNNNEELELTITGFSDGLGTKEINDRLSIERAKTVYDYIVSQGIDARRLQWTGLGHSNPLTNSKKVSKNVVNRRVEFIIVDKETIFADQ